MVKSAINTLDAFLHKVFRKARLIYYHQFELVVFITAFPVLMIGLACIDVFLPFSVIIAITFLFSGLIYYIIYFSKHRKSGDVYTYGDYQFRVFSFWGIIVYNVLFIASLAFIAVVCEAWIALPIFGGETYATVLVSLFKATFNGLLLGALDPMFYVFDKLIDGDLTVKYVREPSILATLYTYTVSIIADAAFLTSAWSEITEWTAAKKDVTYLLEKRQIKPSTLSGEDLKRTRIFLNYIRTGEIQVKEYEMLLAEHLQSSGVPETRTIFLNMMKETHNMSVFCRCLDYFSKNEDWRFCRECSRIQNNPREQAKQKHLAAFKNRQIKLKPQKTIKRKDKT